MLRLKKPLWLAVLAGGIAMLALGDAPLADWWRIPLDTLLAPDFLIMELMILGILLLSGIQGATGQSGRLVDALDGYLRWPRIRLVIFPALVGLLPMPGGALFSCPMLEAAAHGMDISPRRKTLINYWFRHIWELAWPLYPGYILVSSLLGLPLLTLLKYTGPLVLFSFAAGWFFFMRDIRPLPGIPEGGDDADTRSSSLGAVLYEALPMLITILGAAVFGMLFSWVAPGLPAQAAFLASLSLALLTALWQGRGRFGEPLSRIVLSRSMLSLLLLIYVIYMFKNTIDVSGIVADMSHVGGNRILVYLLFILLPFVCGTLTGVMVGYVGACFPILLGVMAQAGMQDEALPLVIIGIVCGNIGQLITPLHVCIVVTCEYYKVRFMDLWRKLVPPLAVQFCYGVGWAMLLYRLGVRIG